MCYDMIRGKLLAQQFIGAIYVKRQRWLTAAAIVPVLLITAVFLIRNDSPGAAEKIERTEFFLDTMVECVIYAEDPDMAAKAMDLAFAETARLELLLDRFNVQSEVAKINEAAGREPVVVSSETLEIIERALWIGELSDGAFDITVAPLLELWGFGSGDIQIPPRDELNEVLSKVNFREVRLNRDNSTVFLPRAGMSIDLGGIAKGYIVDRAAERLIEQGITSAFVDAGGDIRVVGVKPGGTPWRIGVRNPRNRAALAARLDLKDQAIVTSGDYERYAMMEGRRYHHILDPQTGYPAGSLISVTVVANDAFTADALSTAVFVMGPDKGMALIESLPDAEAILITADEKIHLSGGLEGKVAIYGD